MAEIVVMPKLGFLMETGILSAWRAKEGDSLAVGDVMAEITTDKITYELESQVEGVLLRTILEEGAEAAVGEPIAVIGRQGEDISGLELAAGRAAFALDAAPGADEAPGHGGRTADPGRRVIASPAAKKLAAELDMDISAVTGTGPRGRVTMEDVRAAASPGAAAKSSPPESSPAEAAKGGRKVFATSTARSMAAELEVDLNSITGSGLNGRITADDVAAAAERVRDGDAGVETAGGHKTQFPGTIEDPRGGAAEQMPYTGMRRIIGKHTDESRRLSPGVTYHAAADVEQLKEMLAAANAARSENDKIGITAAVIKAAGQTIRRMPRFNATLENGAIKVWRKVNIGVVVALPEGLVVPVIRQADRKTLGEIGREVRDLAARARMNRLLPDEAIGGTFTVSALGSYRSVDFFNPIINQPEAAVLGVGRMVDTVVAVRGEPAVRATMGLSLTCDHRMLDGAPAAEFLRALMDYLENPVHMLV
ncbi:MAG: 2-oxo acid dehydrogenase subunit E2 [Acidobacteria bacterium]|nr:2-oxo acid dehydrogenase subunit E2 [Acidobacteriota bacterium]